VIILLIVMLAPGFALGSREQPQPPLVGTIPEHLLPAADFTLSDQLGEPFHLASCRGRVVVLTFIYTHCEDECPFVTLKLKRARALLGSDAGRAVFVAVTTDPRRDTRGVIERYSREAGMLDGWRFLTGSLDEVKSVWSSYGVGVRIRGEEASEGGKGAQAEGESSAQGLTSADRGMAGKIVREFGGGYDVSHSIPILIIDPSGNVRALLDARSYPKDIAQDVRALVQR
jgi:protein SCO1/2